MKTIHYFLGCIAFFCVGVLGLSSQAQVPMEGSIGTGLILNSGPYTPFWNRAMQQGLVPSKGSTAFVDAHVHRSYEGKKRGIDLAYGADLRFNVGTAQSQFLIPQAFLNLRYRKIEFLAGRKNQVYGLVDSTLSSGSFIWSGNAMAMPKIEFSLTQYQHPKIFGGWFGFRGNYAHGWFDNQRGDVSKVFLHQKSFYGRLGRPNSRLRLYAGFNHQVQWGGTLKYADPTNVAGINGKVPSDLRNYFYVVTGISLGYQGDTTKNGKNDAYNRAGNHVGTIDIGGELDFDNFTLLGYRQSIYEDGSLYYLSNISDGLNGLSFKSKRKKGLMLLTLEYFNSASQGGALGSTENSPELRGRDNYFNNSVYREGWTYLRNSLGTPFMTLDSETDINKGESIYFDNNRVEAYYLGFKYQSENASLSFRGSIMHAFGNYGGIFPAVKKQYAASVFYERVSTILGYKGLMRVQLGGDWGAWRKGGMGTQVYFSIPMF